MESRRETVADSAVLPPNLDRFRRVALVGLGCAGLAAGLALLTDKLGFGLGGRLDGVRVVLGSLGVLIGGSALSLRASTSECWLWWAGTCWLASLGMPNAWDSPQLVFGVAAIVSLVIAGLFQLTLKTRLTIVSVLFLIHFAGILTAVTSPPPTPWLTTQLWTRVFRPYLQFMYLNNAYQFYSPDPGPALHLWACGKFTTPEGTTAYDWFKLPRRPEDLKDPLAQTYYRRLSLSEQLNLTGPPKPPTSRETIDIHRRRDLRTDIPFHPTHPVQLQYAPPHAKIQRGILPIYARRIATCLQEQAEPGWTLESLKLYRVQHSIIEPAKLVQRPDRSVYDPDTYLPYFYGEYYPDGRLVSSKDPMLYWMVPIIEAPRTNYQTTRAEERQRYLDYLSQHAGDDAGIVPPEQKAKDPRRLGDDA